MAKIRAKLLARKEQIYGLVFFLVFVFCSHIGLPFLNQMDIYPFSTWRLFDGAPCRNCGYDLLISVGGREWLLTEYRGMEEKYIYYNLSQRVGNSNCEDPEVKKYLVDGLMSQGVRPLKVLRNKLFLSDYVVLNESQKNAALEAVCSL